MSIWWCDRKHAAAVHTRSHRFFSHLAVILFFFFLNRTISSFHTCVHVRSLSLFAHSVSHSWPTNNPSPSHSLSKRYISDRFIHEKGRKRQHPPSNTVNEEWSCVLWWQSIYTWEEGYWYWDRSNIAANEALLPGKWEKRWWTVEEIYEGLTINSKKCKQLHTIQLKSDSQQSISKYSS